MVRHLTRTYIKAEHFQQQLTQIAERLVRIKTSKA